jgi:hypothetical protein
MPRPPSKHVLSGLLQCGTCGGTFFRIDGRALYGCGWHQDRGSSICPNTLKIPQTELEERVLGGVMRVLSPENALYVVERALRLARQRVGRDPAGERKRLLEIATEERNLVALIAKTGDLEAATEKIKALKAEQAALLLRVTKVAPDVEELRRPLMTALADVTGVLKGKPDRAHSLLAKLLAGRRLAVRSDPVRGYVVEGFLRLEIERDPQGLGPGDLARQVAGGVTHFKTAPPSGGGGACSRGVVRGAGYKILIPRSFRPIADPLRGATNLSRDLHLSANRSYPSEASKWSDYPAFG